MEGWRKARYSGKRREKGGPRRDKTEGEELESGIFCNWTTYTQAHRYIPLCFPILASTSFHWEPAGRFWVCPMSFSFSFIFQDLLPMRLNIHFYILVDTALLPYERTLPPPRTRATKSNITMAWTSIRSNTRIHPCMAVSWVPGPYRCHMLLNLLLNPDFLLRQVGKQPSTQRCTGEQCTKWCRTLLHGPDSYNVLI